MFCLGHTISIKQLVGIPRVERIIVKGHKYPSPKSIRTPHRDGLIHLLCSLPARALRGKVRCYPRSRPPRGPLTPNAGPLTSQPPHGPIAPPPRVPASTSTTPSACTRRFQMRRCSFTPLLASSVSCIFFLMTLPHRTWTAAGSLSISSLSGRY